MRTFQPPPKQKLTLSPYPIRELSTRRSNLKRPQRHPSPDLNIPRTSILALPNLRLSPRTNDGTWDDLIKEFTNVLREATRKRRDNVIPAHWKLVEWVEQLAVMTDLTRGLALGENKQEEAYPTPSYLDFGQIAPHPHPDLD